MQIEDIIKKCNERRILPWQLLSEIYGQYNTLKDCSVLTNEEHEYAINYNNYNKLENEILRIYYSDKELEFILIPKAIIVCLSKSKELGKSLNEVCYTWYNKINKYNYDNIIINWAENSNDKYSFEENIERIFVFGLVNNY